MHRLSALPLACAMFLAACAPKPRDAAPTEAPARAPGGDEFRASPETLEDLEAQLEALDAELHGATPEGAANPMDDADEESDRCRRICSLEQSICDVASRICGLADDHRGEARYADACSRAEERCEVATDACSACQ